MNVVILKGNLCKDNEVRSTKNGYPVTNGLLAWKPYYPKDQQPTKEQKDNDTIFIGFEGFGNYPGKAGEQCLIIGELNQYQSTKYGCKMVNIKFKECHVKHKEDATPTTILDEIKKRQEDETSVDDDEVPFK